MALNILKQPFIRLSYAQGANTYFYDSTQSKYGKLVATTASDAHFTEVSQTPTDGNVIPDSATVFVTFQDYSTVIINNFNFYGKPSSSGSSEPTIKLVSGELPDSTIDTQVYSIGDVILAVDLTYGTSYNLAICTNVSESEDSGFTTFTYDWTSLLNSDTIHNTMKVVDSLPSTESDGIYYIGDVVGISSTYYDSGATHFTGFSMYVCTNIQHYSDSGVSHINYSWQEVLSYPNTASTNSSFS